VQILHVQPVVLLSKSPLATALSPLARSPGGMAIAVTTNALRISANPAIRIHLAVNSSFFIGSPGKPDIVPDFRWLNYG
jgi:hypothetical protein